MLSRFAVNSAFKRLTLANKYQLYATQKCLQSSTPAAAETGEAEKKPWEKHNQDDLVRPYPNPPTMTTESYPSFKELSKNDESVEDMLKIYFGKNFPTVEDEKKPERDLVNFPRFVRPVDPPKTRILNLVPEEYFQFFYKKTGVTGPYVFAAGLTTYLLSKEIFVIEHEFAVGVSLFFWICVFLKKFGPSVNQMGEELIIQEEKGWLNFQEGTKKALEQYIANNKHNQEAIKNQSILFNAKRENVHLQREAEYRKRIQKIYEHTKRKLDYQIAKQDTQVAFAQKHMVNWVIDSVTKSITPEQERLALTNSISELKNLATQKAGII